MSEENPDEIFLEPDPDYDPQGILPPSDEELKDYPDPPAMLVENQDDGSWDLLDIFTWQPVKSFKNKKEMEEFMKEGA